MATAKEEKASAGSAIVRILTGRWFLSGVGAVALGLLVWFLGPLIPALDSGLALSLCLALIFFAWLTANLVLDVRAARRNTDMIAQMAGAPSEGRVRSEADRAAAEQVGVLRQKLEQALTVLRKSQSRSSKKRQYLYELPWYIMIGPPGSGKTTALDNSGLKFPLAKKFGKEPLKGVGGTRDCEWMFSEDAILLDTAGRYTTQDSNRQVDERAWQGFLRLLKQFRPRQPINGIMIAIGVSDLLAMTPAVRSAWAKEIQERLAELHGEFNLKLPVYVLLTKADLIAGFVEFFDDLDREDRGQVWGTTFTLDDASQEGGAIAAFDAEFDALTTRLNERLLERIQDERDSERRARIFGFPMQFASLKPVLQEFLAEIFTPTRFAAAPPLLRGVYLTSATQQGTPFDRLLETMGKTLGLKLPAATGPGRAYFITRLLKDIIFEEASLVGANPKVERRNRLIRAGALSAVAVVGALLIAAWTVSYLANSSLIGSELAAAADYRTMVDALPKTPVSDDNVTGVMPALDRLRSLPAGYDTAQAGTPLMRGFGLNQGRKLESQAVRAYRLALDRLLLPHLLVGIETQLRTTLTNPDSLEIFLPIYLALGDQGPSQEKARQENLGRTKAALATILGPRAYPRLAPEESRAQFEKHLNALFEDMIEPAVLDTNLLGRARQIFGNTPIPARAYVAIRTSAAARALPDWRVVDHAGAAASQVFVRKSGKLLSDGVPGFFTYRGFHEVLAPQVSDAVKKAVEETSWVLGPQQAIQPDNRTVAAYEQQTVDRFSSDFITIWDQFLDDVTVAPSPDKNQLANMLIILSGPGSPLNLFARAAAEETTMNRPATGPAADAAKAATDAATKAAGAAGGIAGQLLSKASYNSAAIDDHYKALHDRVAGPPGQTPLDNLMKQLGDLANAADAAPRLQQLAPTLPPPLQSTVGGAAGASSKLNATEKRAAIQNAYQQTVLPVCRLVEGRYPLAKNLNPAPIDDFRSFFMPGGVLDMFFVSNGLANYLDRGPAGWKNKTDRDSNLNLSGSLGLLQLGQRVRDSFFGGGPSMTVMFDVTPTGLGDDIQKVDLDIDGQTLTYERGSTPPPKTMQWPGPNSAGGARVVFTRMSGAPATIGFVGPWGLLQLLDSGLKGGNAPDQFPIVFTASEGLTVRFQIAVRSARNPLRNHNFELTRCPAQL